MAEASQTSKLAVILHADVAGSTALVKRDEHAAHESIQGAFRRFGGTIAAYGGHVRELRGDALLAEFERVSDAVTAAMAFQAGEPGRSGTDMLPRLRVGIALGEIIVADNTMTGAGVVLAQRLEQLAEPGGVVIQGAAYETLPHRLPFHCTGLGEHLLKGFDEPVRPYRVGLKDGCDVPPPASTAARTAPPGLPDKPSIAVLPFVNMSGDPDQEYFSDGITEDIITALSRMPWFFVIARNSSFAYKGKAADLAEIASELGVRYILEGSVRKSGRRLRITAQLIEASTRKHVWAERYDRELADIFAVQDEVTDSIVGEVAPGFLSAEARRAQRADPAALNAWDLVMRGRWHMWKLARDHLARARTLFEQAVELVPSGEFGSSDLALTHMLEAYYNWTDSRAGSMQAMLRCARQAVAADDHDAWAHTTLGLANLFAHRWDEALPPLDRAIALYPNFAPALGIKGMVLACLDETEAAIECFDRARRLSPHDSLIPLWLIGRTWAYWVPKRYDEALACAKELVRLVPDNPTGRRQMAACYAAAGQIEDARRALSAYLELEPNHTAADIRERLPSRNPEPLDRFVEALRRAGLPG